MRYETAEAFRQALERRLLDRSRETEESLLRLRKAVVFDRLLARLVVVAVGRWVLKGALALDFRLGERGRTTKDIDLVRRDDEQSATADLLAAQAEDLGDFFVFAVEKVGRPAEAEGGAIRYHVRAELGGRLFDEVLVDVGFLDPLRWEPELVKGSDLLSFSGLESIEVPALPLEQQVAEKVHAYTRTYGAGSTSSRVKDLVDMILVKRSIPLRANRLRRALEATFESRGGPALPMSLPPPPPDWAAPYRKLANEVGIDPELEQGYSEAAALLTPVLGGLARGRWVPARGRWNEE
jgi:hypothetical protein